MLGPFPLFTAFQNSELVPWRPSEVSNVHCLLLFLYHDEFMSF